ncbi:hypothetical protein [Smaragdicoccus niigatensis]|uniref:hypothetical protein n=1 Tax=Smaragdicoccus niigatensis TaxID=359359 RepID=UPI00036A8260|nr:hypothetical protein [Smaragdicoccus niigatensis]
MGVGITIGDDHAMALSGNDSWRVRSTGAAFADKAVSAVAVFAGQRSAVSYPARFSPEEIAEARSALDSAGLGSTVLIPAPIAAVQWLQNSSEVVPPGFVVVCGVESGVTTVATVQVGRKLSLAGRALESAADLHLADLIRHQLADAGLSRRQVSYVLLTSAFPVEGVQQIADSLGIPVATDATPSTIVLRGAAIIAEKATRPAPIPRLLMAGAAAAVFVGFGSLALASVFESESGATAHAQVSDAISRPLASHPASATPTTTFRFEPVPVPTAEPHPEAVVDAIFAPLPEQAPIEESVRAPAPTETTEQSPEPTSSAPTTTPTTTSTAPEITVSTAPSTTEPTVEQPPTSEVRPADQTRPRTAR